MLFGCGQILFGCRKVKMAFFAHKVCQPLTNGVPWGEWGSPPLVISPHGCTGKKRRKKWVSVLVHNTGFLHIVWIYKNAVGSLIDACYHVLIPFCMVLLIIIILKRRRQLDGSLKNLSWWICIYMRAMSKKIIWRPIIWTLLLIIYFLCSGTNVLLMG